MRAWAVAAGAAGVWLVGRELGIGAVPLAQGALVGGVLHLTCLTFLAVYGAHASGAHRRQMGFLASFQHAVKPGLVYAVLGTATSAVWTFGVRSELHARMQAERAAAVAAPFATDATYAEWKAATGAPDGVAREQARDQQLEAVKVLDHPGVFIGMNLLGLAWGAALLSGVMTAVWRYVLGG
jgi:hypothetical protein